MTPKREPNKKNVAVVEELNDLIKNKKTILLASIKNIPASQFQEIVKKLRGKAVVKVPKKNLIFRALDSSGKEEVKKLREKIQDSVALLFSDLDSFELAAELINSKSPAKAKTGQEAPEEIEVPAGPTDLIPGPAISELGALGIQIQIEKGKITIKEPKIIAKQGEKISAGAADVMNKLDIKPFSIGFIPLCSFDNQEGIFYSELKIDKEQTLEELKSAYGKSMAFAVEIGYTNEDTIKFLLGKAESHAKVLEKLKPVDEKPAEEKAEEPKPEEVKEDAQENNQTLEDKNEGGNK